MYSKKSLTVDRFGTVEIGRRFEPHDGHLVKYRSQRVCTSLVSCEGSQFWECLSDAIDFMRFDFKVETLEKYRIIIVIGVENVPHAEVYPNSLGAHNEDRLVVSYIWKFWTSYIAYEITYMVAKGMFAMVLIILIQALYIYVVST